ncbi:HD domain-containing protein [Paraburkholderia sp. SARCC-3016]|uniref:HD domain-containing protein n=1 Tax=Paraburkholderia sp. SARCC-3016 TaxID=3058611 RepID=UPI002809F4FF|nr:HD domain-containing protein [Paraburkholderia sp. SARCC-3016]MDQ7982088.1 HD domain-containing protein [Paraburkholderia sp. SARCC-3016]
MQIRTGVIVGLAALLSVFAGAVQASANGTAPPPAPDPIHRVAQIEPGGISVPDSQLARDATRLVRESEGKLLFDHSMRVYYWAAMAGKRKGLAVDPELLYVASMFHDFGLTQRYQESHLRYEVDGANAARDFLRSHGVSEADSQTVWLAIALHTTNGVSPHLFPLAALVAEGANMDLVGAGYDDFTSTQRNAVESAYPHPRGFADEFMQSLYDSLAHRPETTQGTGLADVMAYKDPRFVRRDFSALMRRSPWEAGR